MGRRYQAILNYLGYWFVGIDLDATPEQRQIASLSKHFIVATPTQDHKLSIKWILENTQEPVSILCEKPISTNEAELVSLYSQVSMHGSNLYCVNQYAFMPHIELATTPEPSLYDYYNHGKDGLHWDCFQIYALAKGEVRLAEQSPLWTCVINGLPLQIKDMDRAYIKMLDNFLGDKSKMWRRDVVLSTTEKILRAL
jgi:hypothetical protein